jgi:tRNA threonylcarbamoyladenosine biosynthesis protein TsaB
MFPTRLRAPDRADARAGRGAPPMNTALLAFDTSTEHMAVAVQSAHGLWCFNGAGGALASQRLIQQIHELLGQAGLELRQLQAIAFGRGPGAFSGLRTACAVAQGLAFGARLPVLPVDSLLIVAEGLLAERADAPRRIDVVMDARMGEGYFGAYRFGGLRWAALREPALLDPQALNLVWAQDPPQCVTGSALEAFGHTLDCGAALRVPQPIDRAAALMRLAQQAWHDGGGVDAALALPLYLRDKVALTSAERDARKVAAA